jgi:tetratricopeptide (TPR) repeat protein
MIKPIIKIALTFLFFLVFLNSNSQKTFIYKDAYKSYKVAQELYDKEKFSSAQSYFKDIIDEIDNPQDETRINAEYYFAVCALKLYHQSVESLLTRFVLDHPDHPKSKDVFLQLARHYYRMKKFNKSIEYFDKVDQYDLSLEDQNEYLFKLGYSKFIKKNIDEAKVHLNELLQRESDYKIPATYYYSHIAYTQGKYQTSLVGFKQIAQNKMFKSIIPYYITQILYKQNKYDELIEYAPSYMDSVTEKRKGEFAKLIGDAYYKNNSFKTAIKYYKIFKKNTKSNRQSNYQVAYSYYRINDYEKAISLFSRVATKNDSLSQTAYYHMADAFLKSDEKDYARNAFEEASKLDFDKEIKRNSLFNYAKLAYELSYNPYDESINAFQNFIDSYPNTEDAEEAYEFLLKVYLTTKNYQDALNSMERIKNKDPRMQKAYQTIVFNRAVEQFHNRDYSKSQQCFELVKKYPIDQELNALSQFWIAECFYKIADFDQAIKNYESFRFSNGALLTKEYRDLDFHIGYAFFDKSKPYTKIVPSELTKQKKDLNNAIKYLRNYTHQSDIKDSSMLRNALLRIADGYFLLKNDSLAIENYQKALTIDSKDQSYALYQMATSQGLVQDYQGKMQTLKRLTKEFPDSKYQVLSLLNLAQSYKDLTMNLEAIDTYLKFIEEYPNNNFISQAHVEVGSIYLKEGNIDECEKYLLKIINDYPDAELENELAIELMMDVYNKRDNLPGYYQWLESKGITVSEQEKDSTFWRPVQLARDNGDCQSQLEKATYYLDNLSNPIKEISAHYYMATCLYSQNKRTEALFHYDFITTKPNNNYYPEALKYAGEITFQSEQYKLALGHFSTLENVGVTEQDLAIAKRGQFYCFHFLNNPQSTIDYAKKVLSMSDQSQKTQEDAFLFLGQSFMAINQLDSALKAFKKVMLMTKSIAAAEAKYHICKIFHLKEDYAGCESQIMELVKQKPSYDYWLAKGIILLGDNFISLEDYFNAKHSLKSIVDNYIGEQKEVIIAEAVQKLEYVESLEDLEKNSEPEQQEMEIEFDNEDPKDKELFNDQPSKDNLKDNDDENKNN